jgi:competence protein ComGC
MDIVEMIIAGVVIAILIVMFIGSMIEKTSIEGYQEKNRFYRGKKK